MVSYLPAKQQDSNFIEPGLSTTVAVGGSSTPITGPLARGSVVRLVSTVAVYIAVGLAPVADSVNSIYLPANIPEYFAIPAGYKLAAIQVTGAGSVNITIAAE